MGNTNTAIRTLLRRADIEVGRYRRSIPARRQQILEHCGVDLLVDVGANIGQYASQARRAGYRHRILSIEPVLAPYRELEARSAADPLWDIRRTAVGAEGGTLILHVSEASVFNSALPVLDTATAVSPRARQL